MLFPPGTPNGGLKGGGGSQARDQVGCFNNNNDDDDDDNNNARSQRGEKAGSVLESQ